jgi:hypothetical protein
MIKFFIGPLPEWAEETHPFLRYELRARGKRRPALFWLGVLLAVVLLGVVGYVTATQFLSEPLSPNLTESANRLLYAPSIILQVIILLATYSLTTGVIGDAVRRQQWDTLRTTESGAALSLRTRWASVFYRLRPLLIIITLIRLVLVVGILWDLMAFQGQYLDLLISGIVPQLSIPVTPEVDLGLPVAILLLAFMLTAGVLLPFTGVAFDAALGLLVSSYVRQRVYSVLVQFVLILVRIGAMIALGYGFLQFMDESFTPPDVGAFALMFGFGGWADWGLRFLHLSVFGEIWARVPYGVFLGLALLVMAIVQVVLARLMLALAIRHAQRQG